MSVGIHVVIPSLNRVLQVVAPLIGIRASAMVVADGSVVVDTVPSKISVFKLPPPGLFSCQDFFQVRVPGTCFTLLHVSRAVHLPVRLLKAAKVHFSESMHACLQASLLANMPRLPKWLLSPLGLDPPAHRPSKKYSSIVAKKLCGVRL